MNDQEWGIILRLWSCVRACKECIKACLNERDNVQFKYCIKLFKDNIDVCVQSDRLLQRGSEIAYQFLALCENVCLKCEKVCLACAYICHDYHEPLQLKYV
ncbi:hypothetical protein NAF17_15110 [Mucilaginibacter sp. RB4R14]|uniref:hypothetical protein n=1 Tax=Mucilaginibacter aurantiaciroseus TaxID=2949308 RepID=UPI002090D375|nr:hypothetical protein [Mucilaginibacter aurantiaciroseus]MCO5936871.1 hypothetical protein [Mucilaginibacter aurantiaciroseus]